MTTNGSASSDSAYLETQIEELRGRFCEPLEGRLPRRTKVAFIEFPYDTNVGNHMMWLAGMRYFESRNISVVYPTHINVYDAPSLRRAIGNGPIVFNGGVGLSALWPRHTEIKRTVVREFPDNPILVFPSTVAFRSSDEQDTLRDLFGSHRNIFVMARDRVTYEVIRDTFRTVRAVMVPDVTFMLPPQRRRRPPEYPITWLVRNDHESIGYAPPKGVHTFDWAVRTLVTSADFPVAHYTMRVAGAATRIRNRGVAPAPVEAVANHVAARLYRRVSERILKSGNDDLDRGHVVVTDRFHTHILAVLRRQPVVLLVDAFGKNKNSYDTWTHRFPDVHLALSAEDALEKARRIARDAGYSV
jgi:exopolysaccharide biosynthesis predicted pyruvyltransferase EpsI